MPVAQLNASDPIDVLPHSDQASSLSTPSTWRRLDHPTRHDRFRQIFLDHGHTWCDLRLETQVPADQRAYVQEIIHRLLLCRNPWRERIKASFAYDPLECPCCGRTLELVEIWEPKRGHIWMKRWLETHRLRKAARQALQQLRAALPNYHQLAFNFNST